MKRSLHLLSLCILLSPVLAEINSNGKADNEDNKIEITEFHIWSKVESRFAVVNVYSSMINRGNESKDTSIMFQIPETAFISTFYMVINGSAYSGKLYPKNETQKYDEAKEKGQTAWQITHLGISEKRDMDAYKVSFSVAADSEVSIHLTYQELLKRKLSRYVQRFIIQPQQIVRDLILKAEFEEPQGFKQFDFQLRNGTQNMTVSGGSVKLRESPDSRTIYYKPSAAEQIMYNNQSGMNVEFEVQYDVNQKRDGGVMIINNGCFVHYLAPSDLSPLNKNIIFLIDISGSMAGNKINRTRESLLIIFDKLRPEDVFNLILFNGTVIKWRQEPQVANSENITLAKQYVEENVIARGSTNINSALLEAIHSLQTSFSLSGTRSNLIMFLSDGQPSSGVTDLKTIQDNVRRANSGTTQIAIFSLAFGFNLDFEFLKKLSWDNNGDVVRIYDDQDADKQLTAFFSQIESPVLVNIAINYNFDSAEVTQNKYLQYFDGTELVTAGKINDTTKTINVTVTALTKTGQIVLKVNTKLVKQEDSDRICKLYAYLKVKDLLKKMAVAETTEVADRYERLAQEMSLKYGFVTPLTSFVVVVGDPVTPWERPEFFPEAVDTDPPVTTDLVDSTNSAGFLTPRFALCYITLLTAASP